MVFENIPLSSSSGSVKANASHQLSTHSDDENFLHNKHFKNIFKISQSCPVSYHPSPSMHFIIFKNIRGWSSLNNYFAHESQSHFKIMKRRQIEEQMLLGLAHLSLGSVHCVSLSSAFCYASENHQGHCCPLEFQPPRLWGIYHTTQLIRNDMARLRVCENRDAGEVVGSCMTGRCHMLMALACYHACRCVRGKTDSCALWLQQWYVWMPL